MAETVDSIIAGVGKDFDLHAYLTEGGLPVGASRDDANPRHVHAAEGQDHG